MYRGTVVSLHRAAQAAGAMEKLDQAKVVVGKGIEGDRYFAGIGSFSKHPGEGREVTLIESEALEALAKEKNVELRAGDARRNVVTRGVPLNHLVGREFQVGEVRLRGIRLCEPCAHLESLTVAGTLAGLIHRGGLRANVIAGGTIRAGDTITE